MSQKYKTPTGWGYPLNHAMRLNFRGAIMKRLFVVVLAAACSLWAFSDSSDSGSTAQTIQKMQTRLDSLETEFQKLRIEKSDNSPGATGEIKNWGTGYFLSMHLDLNNTDCEFGYEFHRNHCRMGIAVGLQVIDIIPDPEAGHLHSLYYGPVIGQFSPYGSFIVSTPVFLNFISFSGFVHASWLIPTGFGLGTGGDFEFWLNKNWNLLLGPELSFASTGTTVASGYRIGLRRFF
jgi:hypothetical protein